MPDKISRREFIKKSAIGVIAGGTALSGLDTIVLPAKSALAKAARLGDDIVVKLSDEKNASLANVGGSVLLDDENILIRMSQTQFAALNLICRHKGCVVELDKTKFVCPCHGSEYELDGKVTMGPSKENLKTYETVYNSDAGTVTVKMGKREEKIEKKEEKKEDTKDK
ncbi:MAG: ubiquinol-cytochrome c reductase iron-sulfur subunit [Ignavibacteria bacterium]